MHQATVTILQVERNAREAIRQNRWLHLTFRSSEGTRYVWTVPGWPEVHEGMTLTAILKGPLTPERPMHVLGWKSHSTDEIAAPHTPAGRVIAAISCAAAAVVAFSLYRAGPELSSLRTPIPAILFFLLAAWLLHLHWQSRRIVSKLRSLPSVPSSKPA